MLSTSARRPASLQRRHLCIAMGLSALPLSASFAAVAPEIKGVGASFPSKLYARWGKEYAQATGQAVQYKPTGSGDGVKQAIARSMAFAGTDTPLSADDLAKHKLVQLPTCVGGIVPVVQGFDANKLRLTGEVLADIFSGQIERWDDPRIASLNKGLTLPGKRIVRVVRADKSGTTEAFTRYLALSSPRFGTDVGASSQPKWPGELTAAEGNDGVSKAVRATPGAIGYVSHDRVESDGLSAVMLRNRDGLWVASSEAGFRAAILNSDLHRQGQDTASLLDRAGADTWPLTQTSFVLLDAVPATAAAAEPALKFWYWCFMRGDALTKGTGFAPLPTSVQAKLAARFAGVKPVSGERPLYQQL